MISLVVTALLFASSEPAQPAKGSVPGFFLFAEAGPSVLRPVSGLAFGPKASLTAGYSNPLDGSTMLSTTLRADLGLNLCQEPYYCSAPPFSPAQLGLAFAIPDAAPDIGHTGLRATPFVGMDVSFFNEEVFPSVPDRITILMPRFGGQLERRFGPLELAYRLEGRGLFSLRSEVPPVPRPIAFELTQRLFAEVWIVPSFSLAAGFDWRLTWGAPPLTEYPFRAMQNARVPTHLGTTRAVISWNFLPWLGLVIEGTWLHMFQWNGITYSTNTYTGTLAFTARTDSLLQRNWLDR